MGSSQQTQRLAAILAADAAGYSRLMTLDSQAAIAAIEAARGVFRSHTEAHGGRVVDMAGDSVLAVFETATGAVSAALEIQDEWEAANASTPMHLRMRFRIGVHLGDVIEKSDGTVYGDGVNIAARLQAIADPGGLTVSDAIYGAVRHRVGASFEDVGEQRVKNIADAVRVLRVRPVQDHSKIRPSRGVSPRTAGLAVAALFAIGLLGMGGWWAWQYVSRPSYDPVPNSTSGPPLLSVAIMPFVPATGSSDDSRFAERLTQDVISSIERNASSARVVSHGLTARYQDKPTDPRAVGRELNVRYLVAGEVRPDNGTTAVTVRLVDTSSGITVSSARIATPTSSANSGKAVAQLSARVRAMLYDSEEKRVARLPISGANVMELVLQANRIRDQDRSPKGTLAAQKLYEEAVRRDPDSVPALLGLYWTKVADASEGRRLASDQIIKELDELSKRALALDRRDPRVWTARAQSLMYLQQWDRALEANAAALQIDPDSTVTVGDRGWLLLLTGQPEEALPVLDRAIELDPTGPRVHGALQLQCSAHLNLGHYDRAIAACEKALALDDGWLKYLFLLGASAQKGDMARAEAAKAELLKRKPDVSIAQLKSAAPDWANPLYQQQREAHLYAGLRKAAIPEQ